MSADPIPAIAEAAATGSVASVFADLRATLGIPFVNLIWRHLATMPGALEWTWTLVKPLQASEALHAAAEGLRASVHIPGGLPQPECVYEAVGVGPEDRDVIATLLRDYNAANGGNLLSLLVAQAVLDGRSSGSGQPLPPRAPRAPQAAPRLLGLDELPPATLALVRALDDYGRINRTPAIASLYRHLGHWPGFLAVVHAALASPHAEGRLRDAHAKLRDRAQEVAVGDLLPRVTAPTLPRDVDLTAAKASLEHFTSEMIARMTVMGELMLAMLPEARTSATPPSTRHR